MIILSNWRYIASAWIIVVALIFGPTMGMEVLAALRAPPQQSMEGVVNPRHDGAHVNHTSSHDGDR